MSERVPDGWSPASFGDLAKVINGYAFQSSDFVEKSETSVPIIRMSSLKAGIIDLNDAVHVAEEKTKGLEKFLLGKGDFVFGMSGSISNFAIIKEQDGVCYQNQRVGRLSPINASREFVSQLFLSEGVTRQIEGLAAGGAQLNISSSQIENLNILNPPLPEQKKIASILTSVDEVIENTQKQIEKLQDLKKATMNELLTKGISHTEFKDSELGRIPKSWDVKRYSDLVTVEMHQIPLDDHNYYAPVVVRRRHNGVETRGEKLGSAILVKTQYQAIPGTFLISKRQIFHGSCGIVPNNIGINAVISKEYLSLKTNDLMDLRFLNYFARTAQFQNQIVRTTYGVDEEKFVFKDQWWLKEKIVCPPRDEQSHICDIIDGVDANLSAATSRLFKTQSLKKSLMQDLLTGKVRVQVN